MVRKRLNALRPDVLNHDCPSRWVLERVADKWTALVVYALAAGTLRYGTLQRKVDGISQKMLTQVLRQLETDGIIQRVVYPIVPPKVEYSLTPLGEDLTKTLSALCTWVELHLPQILAAQARNAQQNIAGEKSAPSGVTPPARGVAANRLVRRTTGRNK